MQVSRNLELVDIYPQQAQVRSHDTTRTMVRMGSTNASTESFKAKVKAFRLQFKGVTDIPFFIFRLATLFA